MSFLSDFKKVVILLCNDIKLSGLLRALLEHSSSLKELNLLLSFGALCRRKDRVSDGGAEEDYQRWSQDARVHPVSD